MRPVVVLCPLLLALTGCYASHDLDDAGPVDAVSLDAPRDDATRPTADVSIDATTSSGADAGLDAAFCLCATDADCPPPPPSWNCLRPTCSECMCALRLEPSLCGPGAACDATGSCFSLPVDAATPDAGPITRPDAFVVPVDAGPRPDAFVVPIDAFVSPVDAFVPPIDAFTRDSGRPATSNALRFTSDQVMTVPNRPGLSIGPELTFELWVRLRSAGVIAIKGSDAVGSHLYLEARPPSADGTFRTFWVGWASTDTRVRIEIDRPVPFDTWTHFALVQRQTPEGRVTVELFVDGESAAGTLDGGDTATYLASFNAGDFTIGHADMDIDEIRLWRIARGRSAIQAYMRSALMPGISGLVAYWPLDGVGQVVLDRSLNGNDGYRGTSPAADRADPTWIPDGAF